MTTIVTIAQAERIRSAFAALGAAATVAIHHYNFAVADTDPAVIERIRAQVAAAIRTMPKGHQ